MCRTFQNVPDFMAERMSALKKQSAKRPGPRPKGPYADKRKTLTTRITEQTRTRLEEGAAAADRSLSQEIELRLEHSFLKEDAKFEEFGGRGKYVFMKLLAAVVGVVEDRLGKSFDEDPYVRSQAFLALKKLLEAYFLEEAGEAQAKGQGSLHGDEPIGEEIGLELRNQALTHIIDRMKSSEPPESDK